MYITSAAYPAGMMNVVLELLLIFLYAAVTYSCVRLAGSSMGIQNWIKGFDSGAIVQFLTFILLCLSGLVLSVCVKAL